MGRKKLKDKERRKNNFMIRFTDGEMKLLVRFADGKPLARFIREKILSK